MRQKPQHYIFVSRNYIVALCYIFVNKTEGLFSLCSTIIRMLFDIFRSLKMFLASLLRNARRATYTRKYYIFFKNAT